MKWATTTRTKADPGARGDQRRSGVRDLDRGVVEPATRPRPHSGGDGFADTELITRFNGNRAVRVDVSRTADEQVLEIAEAVRAYLAAEVVPFLPEGVEVEIWRDDTTLVGSRLSLLIENGLVGLVLVFLRLTLFLEVRLAVWVGAGLVVSLVATLWVMMILGISINMFSMLALITAFCALLAVPGPSGKLMRSIPIVVIAILAISLVESLLILPRHLSHLPPSGTRATTKCPRNTRRADRGSGCSAGGGGTSRRGTVVGGTTGSRGTSPVKHQVPGVKSLVFRRARSNWRFPFTWSFFTPTPPL